MKSTSEKLHHFAQFVTLLTGSFEVRMSTSDQPEPGTLVLPHLDELDDASVDVLYGLCLREVGHLARSKKTIDEIKTLTTASQLTFAGAVEAARVERFLCRKFGGGGEILAQHFGEFAHDPRFTNIILGIDPSACSDLDAFAYAVRWHLMGRPKWSWGKLFGARWEKLCSYLDHPDLLAVMDQPMRSWSDALTMSQEIYHRFLKLARVKDETAPRAATPEEKAFEKAREKMENKIAQAAAQMQKKLDETKQKANELREQAAAKEDSLKDKIDPLRQEVDAARDVLKTVRGAKDAVRQVEQAQRQRDKINSKMAQAAAREEQMAEKVNELSSQDPTASVDERERDLQQKRTDAQKGHDEKMSELEAKKEAAQQDLQNAMDAQSENAPGTKAHERAMRAQERAQEKINALDEKMAAAQQRFDEKMKELDERSQRLDARREKMEKNAQDRMEKVSSKKDEAAAAAQQLADELAKADQARERAMQQLGRELRAQGLDAQSLDDMMAKIDQAQNVMNEKGRELDKLTAPIENLKEKASELEKSVRQDMQKQHFEMEKLARQIQDELASQGIECNLLPEREEMEGWPEANAAQRNFDQKASEQLQMSVINGQGGGRGARDMMVDVATWSEKIAAIDPNQIFADVASLSPLSGFSQSGAVSSGKNSSKNNVANTHSAAATAVHTVWSRRFDRVIPAPQKNHAMVQKLRTTHASLIREVKQVVAKKLRPSFKSKFVGGREEGDLDNRNLWKLAARQDNDFFEVTQKRPDTKTAASIVVDLSGSMASWGEDGLEQTRAVVLALSEALSAAHVPHEILGYYAPIDEHLASQTIPSPFNRKSCRLETLVMKNFKDKDVSGLASLTVQQAENSDGESLKIAIERLKKQPGKTKLLFWIADGKPYMQDADAAILDGDVRSALMQAHAGKIAVLGLSRDVNEFLGDNQIIIDQLSQLPKQLAEKL